MLGLDRKPSLPPIDHACLFSFDRWTSSKAQSTNSGVVVPVAEIVVDKDTGDPVRADQLIIA